jgi:hypothetical protein
LLSLLWLHLSLPSVPCLFDVDKCIAYTNTGDRSQLTLSSPSCATIGYGPVNIFTDFLINLDENDVQIVHLSFVKSGSNDAWSVGLLPLARENDKRFTLCNESATARSHRSNGVPTAHMPSGAIITTWVNIKERMWNISVPERELVKIPIPESDFPLFLAFNGGSSVTITLVPDAALPDELSDEIHELQAKLTPQMPEGDYKLCNEDIHAQHPQSLFDLLLPAFPQSFLSENFEALSSALSLLSSPSISEPTSLSISDPFISVPRTKTQKKKHKKHLKHAARSSAVQRTLVPLPDLSEACWTDPCVTVPMHGVFSIGTIRLHCTSSHFASFFPANMFGNFDGVDVYAVPVPAGQEAARNAVLHSIEVRTNSPSLSALVASDRTCSAVAVFHGLEDSALEADQDTLHLLLHPSAPQSVICACLIHLSSQLAPFANQNDKAAAIFEAARAPLVQLVRFFCCKNDSVPFLPGTIVQISGGGEEHATFEGAFATVCKCIEGMIYTCSVWSSPECSEPCGFVTIEGGRLQFVSQSRDVWCALLSFCDECIVKKPLYLIDCGIADMLFGDLNLAPAATDILSGVSSFRATLGNSCCIMPRKPNDPVDIAGGATNNWPPILDNAVADVSSCGLPTFRAIVSHFFCGEKHFVLNFAQTEQEKKEKGKNFGLSQGKCILLFRSIRNHFVKYWDERMYFEFVLETLHRLFPASCSAVALPPFFSICAPAITPFIRCLIKLTLCGRLPVASDRLTPFLEQFFNRDDVKLGSLSACDSKDSTLTEPQIAASYRLFVGLKKLLAVAEPHRLPVNTQGLQLVYVERDILHLIRCPWGDVALPFVVHTSSVRASLLFGWCCHKNGEDCVAVPIAHSAIIASFLHFGKGISVSDISQHCLLDSQVVEECLSDLLESRYVWVESERPVTGVQTYALSQNFMLAALKKPSSKHRKKSSRPPVAQSAASDVPSSPSHFPAIQYFSGENNSFEFSVQNASMFIRIIHRVMASLLSQYHVRQQPVSSMTYLDETNKGPPPAVVPIFEGELIQQVCEHAHASIKDVRCALLYLETKRIIVPVTSGSRRHFLFGSKGLDLASSQTAKCDLRPPHLQGAGIVSELERLTLDGQKQWDKHTSPFQNAIVFVPNDDSVSDLHECDGCVEFPNKTAVQQYFGETISQLHDTLQIPFFTAAQELTLCHGDVCRVIIKSLSTAIHDDIFGQVSHATVPATRPQHAAQSPVNHLCAVCSDAGDEDISIIQLPCGHNLCEDCFAARFLNETGALPEAETPCAQAPGDETPKTKPDFFTCPNCQQEFLPSFWESFPQVFEQVRRSSYCKPDLTLSDVHFRIVASVLRKLRCDPLAAVARCPETSRGAAGRYAIAFGLNHEVTCFGSTFESIIDARTVGTDSRMQILGISSDECEKWSKIQHEVKTFENKMKKKNHAGNSMVLKGSSYYCGQSYQVFEQVSSSAARTSPQKLGKNAFAVLALLPPDGTNFTCGPTDGQCRDCALAEAELAKEVKPEFVKDSERGDREKDIRMCPFCFGGYFLNTACGDLAAHHGQRESGSSVRNACPGMYDVRACVFCHAIFMISSRLRIFLQQMGRLPQSKRKIETT